MKSVRARMTWPRTQQMIGASREYVVSLLEPSGRAHDRFNRQSLFAVDRRFRELLVDPSQLALADAVCTDARVSEQSAVWRDVTCAAIPLHTDESVCDIRERWGITSLLIPGVAAWDLAPMVAELT